MMMSSAHKEGLSAETTVLLQVNGVGKIIYYIKKSSIEVTHEISQFSEIWSMRSEVQ